MVRDEGFALLSVIVGCLCGQAFGRAGWPEWAGFLAGWLGSACVCPPIEAWVARRRRRDEEHGHG